MKRILLFISLLTLLIIYTGALIAQTQTKILTSTDGSASSGQIATFNGKAFLVGISPITTIGGVQCYLAGSCNLSASNLADGILGTGKIVMSSTLSNYVLTSSFTSATIQSVLGPSVYDPYGSASSALTSAKSYADTDMNNAISTAENFATSADATNLATAESYADSDKAAAISAAEAYSSNASNLTSGTVAPARLGSGSPASGKYLDGSGAWITLGAVGLASYPGAGLVYSTGSAFSPATSAQIQNGIGSGVYDASGAANSAISTAEAYSSNASNLTSGNVPLARLGTGTAAAGKYVDGGTGAWTTLPSVPVSSVFGRTGAVVAASGDYTTSQVTESGSLYFTNARAIASTLTGYTSGAGTISSSDTVLSAIQKLNGNVSTLVTGVSSVFGRTGVIAATSGDYSVSQITGAAPLASPTFSGTVTLPDGSTVTSSAWSLSAKFPTLNQSTTGQAGSVANAHSAGTGLSGSAFNGSAAQTWTLAAAYGDSINPYASKTANYVLAAPNGSSGTPSFRALVAADIPALAYDASGAAAARAAVAACSSNQYATATTTGGLTCAQVAYSQVSGTPSSMAPSGTASGDLSGSYPSPTVAKINGVVLPTLSGTTGVLYDSNGTLSVTNAPALSAANMSSFPTFNQNTTGTATTLAGSYTGSGGIQGPSYFGVNKVGSLMMDTTVNGDSNYKNWLIMDPYNANDVGGATALGISRVAPRAFLLQSDANRTSWNNSTELLSLYNYNSYAPTLTGGGASGTWGINVTGSSGSANNYVIHSSTDTLPAVVMNVAGAYYGAIGATSTSQTWGLGWATNAGSSMTGYALTWNSSGSVAINGGSGLGIGSSSYTNQAGDIGVARNSSPTTGVIYLGNQSGASHYLYFDGTNYNMPNGALTLNGMTIGAGVSSYGSMTVSGVTNGYAGIQFSGTTNNRTFMIGNGSSYPPSGVYAVGSSSWDWYFNGNTLQIAGNNEVFSGAYTFNQSVASGASPSFVGTNFSGTASSLTAGAANSVAWGNITGKPNTSANGFQWNWSGQGGQPPWLWGGSDGTDMYVYNPSNFSVNYASTAGALSSTSYCSGGNYATGISPSGVPTCSIPSGSGGSYTGRTQGTNGWYTKLPDGTTSVYTRQEGPLSTGQQSYTLPYTFSTFLGGSCSAWGGSTGNTGYASIAINSISGNTIKTTLSNSNWGFTCVLVGY